MTPRHKIARWCARELLKELAGESYSISSLRKRAKQILYGTSSSVPLPEWVQHNLWRHDITRLANEAAQLADDVVSLMDVALSIRRSDK